MTEWNYREWAEGPSNENLKHRLATGDLLLAQANALLTLILVGAGGAIAYGIKIFEPGKISAPVFGAVLTAFWLMAVGAVLVHQCIATRNTDVPGNEPNGIYFPKYEVSEADARDFQLKSIQRRIESTKNRNSDVAWWLDNCRYATLATPAIFLAATLTLSFF